MIRSSDQYIECMADNQRIALPIHGVQEIIRFELFTPTPQSDPQVLGTISWYGNTLPVVRLQTNQATNHTNERAQTSATARILILRQHNQAILGLYVDRVCRIATYPQHLWIATSTYPWITRCVEEDYTHISLLDIHCLNHTFGLTTTR
ncbi:chemotaxis signal transduction protein [Paenibacillus sp. SORGH_AS306]|uniref:chemotaxis protein CheW n=1 Tax=unclassified Paenibacillus TaxID=185978 RepID=UPI0023671FAC|nr:MULTISPECIES: chemotaxis protein CheW [unclassified Paenibacillus]MDQ1236990.1 chemotaxis signal transduction protein [Paenibacillus sp. SORGH_AS_0306]MDR6109351.1 chemotaxis signal transduction protein [Paenibacillus sp. SORGH_AS_0338]WDF50525.1 chemotaxis protein CheW [Paenibacillus sp. KACC 21273]